MLRVLIARASRVHLLLFALLFAVASLFINSALSQEQNDNTANRMETPTPADRALLERYNAAIKQVDKPESPAREMLLEFRRDRIVEFVTALGSTEPVNARTLRRARGYIRYLAEQLEAVRNISLPSPYIVPDRRAPIQIDGRLDEPDWQRSTAVFIQYDRLNKRSEQTATVRLLWDDRFLYAGFTIPDTNIIAPLLERDSEVWNYDCVELFLMPDKPSGAYWEIEISPTGTIYDALCYKYRDRWSSDMRVGETLKGMEIGRVIRGTPNQNDDVDEGYTVEVAIPFDQLPGMTSGPKPGDKIYGLLCWVNRSREDGERTLPLAQVPFSSWFHNIWAYQPLVFSNKVR